MLLWLLESVWFGKHVTANKKVTTFIAQKKIYIYRRYDFGHSIYASLLFVHKNKSKFVNTPTPKINQEKTVHISRSIHLVPLSPLIKPRKKLFSYLLWLTLCGVPISFELRDTIFGSPICCIHDSSNCNRMTFGWFT